MDRINIVCDNGNEYGDVVVGISDVVSNPYREELREAIGEVVKKYEIYLKVQSEYNHNVRGHLKHLDSLAKNSEKGLTVRVPNFIEGIEAQVLTDVLRCLTDK